MVRAGAAAGPEVLIVHRPRYDDWSLPKGKDEDGEAPEEAALREVWEETGQKARIVGRLPDVSYLTADDRDKVVRYYLMRPEGAALFEPNGEVDEIRWVPAALVRDGLTYHHDRDLIDHALLPNGARVGTAFLLRHAHAGSRKSWNGDDTLRPLTDRGRRQSAAIARYLSERGIDRILTSRYRRCVETVEPLADLTGVAFEEDPDLTEGADTASVLDGLHTMGESVVMCSHGDVIPALLGGLQRRGLELRSHDADLRCAKGSIWEVTIDEGVPTVATYHPPPPREAYNAQRTT